MPSVTPLVAAAGDIDITPSVGVALAGALSRTESVGVSDRLHARAVLLGTDRTRVAFVLLDALCIGNEDAQRARHAFAEAAQMPTESVCLSCTHTHSGPSLIELFESPREADCVDSLVRKIGDLGGTVSGRMQPARVAWGTGWEPRAGFNRRYHMRDGSVRMNPGCQDPQIIRPAGPTDPGVPMLMVEATDGRPLAVVANFSLHYVGGTGDRLISADYFGQFAESMKQRKGPEFVALLTHGASGDINNLDVSRPPPRHGPGEQMRRIAGWIAAQVDEQWDRAQFHRHVPIASCQTLYDQGVRKPVDDEIDAARKQWENEELSKVDRAYGRERLLLLDWPDTVPMVVQTIRVGDFGAATMPGEMFCRHGLDLRHASPFPVTALIELANGYGGYVPTMVDYQLGGYETWLARSAYARPGTGEELVVQAACGLRSLYGMDAVI